MSNPEPRKGLVEQPHLSLKAGWVGFSYEKLGGCWAGLNHRCLFPSMQWQKYTDPSSTLGKGREENFLNQHASSKWKFLCRVHRAELGDWDVKKRCLGLKWDKMVYLLEFINKVTLGKDFWRGLAWLKLKWQIPFKQKHVRCTDTDMVKMNATSFPPME